ncbi:MAG: glucose-6-phosphate dehydrogenase [Candidatus Magasanikbacteria bacterium CG11_big_fil_rev_8_21_14_0_20_39_34]|uniref:Glucose-6-phosphate 1-dehydrogenase n=1 Tax=Candidatus Magasanikbacteria bacterium CG11_big_fil_rev_8_21_14_0_20_39_34 TaxID=1974653 RepID=A0A2H0N667_9BACT|nr:MAG: glucose-6-phosphate dehydrogenase [Candidatus Magasanikbacteria bacterium CG11_big_fil_rev_8_21_14_0_20_39_34]
MIPKLKKSFILTIFGASGDLAKIKIFPALYTLARQGRFPQNYFIVGFARSEKTQDEFRKEVEKSIQEYTNENVKPSVLKELLSHVHYFSGQYNELKSFQEYRTFLKSLSKKEMSHIAYFSVPPVVFHPIITNLSKSRKNKNEDIRLVIEKPFGHDYKSAEALFHYVSEHFGEEQFYLLDHYLGKSSVQSILNMRRSNRILSNIIRGSEIANIQITALEEVGVQHRIGYFEHVGIVRDMIQSHLLQIFALTTMTIPNKLSSESLKREKNNVIEAIDCPAEDDNVVLGQYKSYRSQEGVKKTSTTETFAAVRMFIDKENWYKVPIYIRTGKKLHEKHTYISIELKKFPFQDEKEQPNRIIIEFHPEPRINIELVNLQEGVSRYQSITTADSIACNIDGCLPEHGSLLLDVLDGKRLHFLSFSEILSAWRVVDEMKMLMKERCSKLYRYEDGSEGPKEQHRLPRMDGFEWYDLH